VKQTHKFASCAPAKKHTHTYTEKPTTITNQPTQKPPQKASDSNVRKAESQ